MNKQKTQTASTTIAPVATAPKVFQIGEQAVVAILQALGQLPHTQVDPILNFFKRNLVEVTEEPKAKVSTNTLTKVD